MIPLILYFLMLKINFKNRYINAYVSVITALFILGVYKSQYTKEKWYKSGILASWLWCCCWISRISH